LKFFQQTLNENVQSNFDLKISNAIRIVIENYSRKIRDRSSKEIRSAISGSKSIPEMDFKSNSDRKAGSASNSQTEHKIGERFFVKIGSRFSF